VRPFYEHLDRNLEIFKGKTSHIKPHIHTAIECAYVREGSLELGVGQELYHMETGDFAIVFPNVIHHYQVFDPNGCIGTYLIVTPAYAGEFANILEDSCPEYPIIVKGELHSDIRYAIENMKAEDERVIHQAFLQIILSRALEKFTLMPKKNIESDDIVYQVVSYMARNFREEISLESVAKEIGFSQYAVSRVFSGTFHMNFNQYLNEMRLEEACNLLLSTDQSITEAYENAGFESQRTFNRVFKEQFHMSPREYRNKKKQNLLLINSDR
jgi:AraC-like DNA-binding protein